MPLIVVSVDIKSPVIAGSTVVVDVVDGANVVDLEMLLLMLLIYLHDHRTA